MYFFEIAELKTGDWVQRIDSGEYAVVKSVNWNDRWIGDGLQKVKVFAISYLKSTNEFSFHEDRISREFTKVLNEEIIPFLNVHRRPYKYDLGDIVELHGFSAEIKSYDNIQYAEENHLPVIQFNVNRKY